MYTTLFDVFYMSENLFLSIILKLIWMTHSHMKHIYFHKLSMMYHVLFWIEGRKPPPQKKHGIAALYIPINHELAY